MAKAYINQAGKKIASPLTQTSLGGDPSVPSLLFPTDTWWISSSDMVLEDHTWQEWEQIAASFK